MKSCLWWLHFRPWAALPVCVPPPLAAAAAKGEGGARSPRNKERRERGYCALNVGAPCVQPRSQNYPQTLKERALHLLDLLAIFSKEIESNAQMDFERAVAASAYSWLATKT